MSATAEEIRNVPDLLPSIASRASSGVMLAFLVHGLIVGTWVSRIASVKTALRLTDGVLGIALLGAAIGSVAAIPACGWLVTRYGSKRCSAWTAVGFSLALILPALSWDAITLFVALLFYGAMAGANDVAINAQAVATEKRIGVLSMSRFHAMFSVGGIVGSAAGGLIAGRAIGPLTHLASGAALILAIVALMMPLMLDTHDPVEKRGRINLRKLPPALIAFSAVGFCIFLSEGAIADWTSVYLKQVLGATEGLAAAGYAAFSASMAAFRFAGDAITTRLGRSITIQLGGLTAAFGLIIVVAAQSPLYALIGFAAAGAGFSVIIPLVFAAGGRIEGVNEGAGVATVSGFGYLGFLVGPPAIGFVSELTSLRGGMLILVALSLAATALVRFTSPAQD